MVVFLKDGYNPALGQFWGFTVCLTPTVSNSLDTISNSLGGLSWGHLGERTVSFPDNNVCCFGLVITSYIDRSISRASKYYVYSILYLLSIS